jgi:hypothetical protein
MFNSISWSEFVINLSLLIVVYYAVSTAFYYRHEISSVVSRKKEPTNNSSDRVETGHGLMGATKPDAPRIIRKQTVSSEELLIAPPTIDEQNPTPVSVPIIIGTISDLLQESKDLASSLSDTTGSREECATLFQSLLERYPQLNNSTYKEALCISLYHTCKNELGIEYSLNEITTWWPKELLHNATKSISS